MEKKNKQNDQVKVKTKWECLTKVIKRGESKKDMMSWEKTMILSLQDTEILFEPMNPFIS